MTIRCNCPPEHCPGYRSTSPGINSDLAQHRVDHLQAFFPGSGVVRGKRGHEGVDQPHPGIQRRQRILEDELDGPAEPPEFPLPHRQEIATVHDHLAAIRPDLVDEQAGERGLAASRFTNQAQHLRPSDRESHAVNGSHGQPA